MGTSKPDRADRLPAPAAKPFEFKEMPNLRFLISLLVTTFGLLEIGANLSTRLRPAIPG
jgi:hypothetical protein